MADGAAPSLALAIERARLALPFRLPRVNVVFLLTTLVLLYLVGLPLVFLVYGAFVRDIGSLDFTLGNFARVYGNADFLPLVLRTVGFALGSALLALLLGGVPAWITQRTASRLAGVVATANLLALTLPGLLVAIAWISLLAPKSGYINVWLGDLFGVPRGTLDIYSLPGMIWVEAVNGAPFAYLLMVPVLRSMDRSLEEASITSGANGWKTLTRITIPLLVPAILSLVLYRFVRGLESFEIPLLIGLPKGIDVLVTKMFTIISAERQYGVANAYALGLMIVSTLGIYVYNRVAQDTQKYATVTGRGFRARPADIGRLQIVADAVLILYVFLIAALPLLTLVWSAFIPYPMAPSAEAFSNLTLKNFQAVFSSSKVVLAFQNSFIVAAFSALACVLIGTVTARLVLRSRVRGRWLLDVLTFLPLSMPGVIFGVALLWIYLTLPIAVYGTLAILALGYSASFLPTTMRFISPAIGQIHVDLEDAAAMSGAGSWNTFRRILVPLILPAVLGAGLYIFLLLFRVLSVAIVLYTPGTIVVPVLIYQMMGESAGNAVHALLVLNVLILMPFAIGYSWLLGRNGANFRAS